MRGVRSLLWQALALLGGQASEGARCLLLEHRRPKYNAP